MYLWLQQVSCLHHYHCHWYNKFLSISLLQWTLHLRKCVEHVLFLCVWKNGFITHTGPFRAESVCLTNTTCCIWKILNWGWEASWIQTHTQKHTHTHIHHSHKDANHKVSFLFLSRSRFPLWWIRVSALFETRKTSQHHTHIKCFVQWGPKTLLTLLLTLQRETVGRQIT